MKKSILTKKKEIKGKTFTFSGYSKDNYFESLAQPGDIYDEDVLDALLCAAQNTVGQTILDVGANIGYMSTVIAKFNPKSQLHSFEPVASNVVILEKNIQQNNCQNVSVHPFGLGSKKSSISISWDPNNRGGAFVSNESHEIYTDHITSTVAVLDEEYKKLGILHCGLIKVDIEGFELKFLNGSKKFLKEFKPTVIMEINPWCLDALQNITVKQFLKEILEIFPYVHGFWGNKLIDVREHTEKYMHENIVNHRYMNVICSFEERRHNEILTAYSKQTSHLDYEKYSAEYKLDQATNMLQRQDDLISSLTLQNANLYSQIEDLNNLNIKHATTQLRQSIFRSIEFRRAKHKPK